MDDRLIDGWMEQYIVGSAIYDGCMIDRMNG